MKPAPGEHQPVPPPGLETTWTAPDAPPVPETRNDRAADTPCSPPPTTPYLGRSNAPFQPYRFGDYQILEMLGGGGMGTVYRALNIWLNRPEALKVISAGRLASIESRRRFQEEMQSTARLRHPNIVEVFAAGAVDGEPFFTMSLETGGDLTQLTKDGNLPTPQKAAEVVREIAEAVAYAHRQGLIHRDLKPSNVLLTADGRPRVTDFGLAVLLDAAPHVVGVEGTPGYMAPEQADGGADAAGKPCDVYGLGAILYELLTGQPPFQGDSITETLRKVRTEAPTPPHVLNPRTPRNLEQICLKCLEKNPRDRFASASDVAEALSAFLEPVWRRLARRAVPWLVLTLLLLLGGGLAWTVYAGYQERMPWIRSVRETAEAHVVAGRKAAQHGLRSQALESYTLALDRYRELIHTKHFLSDRSTLNLAHAEVRIQRGILLREQQQLTAAEEEFEAARLDLQMLERELGNLPARRLLLAEVYHNLGILYNARGTPESQDRALQHYQQGLVLRKELVADAPSDRVYRRDLARSYGYMGDTELQRGRHSDAASSYENAAQLREQLVAEVRAADLPERELIEALCQRSRDFGNMAAFHDWVGDLELAIRAAEQRRRYFEQEAFPALLPGPFRTDRVDALLILAELRLQQQAEPEPDLLQLLTTARTECDRLLAKLDARDSLDVLSSRAGVDLAEATYQIRRGQRAEAQRLLEGVVETFRRVEAGGIADANDLYRHAKAEAMLAALATEPADRGFHEALALDRLAAASARGFHNHAHREREPSLRDLRQSRPELFRKAVSRSDIASET